MFNPDLQEKIHSNQKQSTQSTSVSKARKFKRCADTHVLKIPTEAQYIEQTYANNKK